MITLGVDLATVDKKTALCALEWPSDGPARIVHRQLGASNKDIVARARSASVIAIDAPFGWPRPWAKAVAAHRPGLAFHAEGASAVLTSRGTDRWVERETRARPLAVGANLIGATAIRCARLVHEMGLPIDVGAPLEPPYVCEVYPAAALSGWSVPYRVYKGAKGLEARALLVRALVTAGLPVELNPADRMWIEASDDGLDAMIASLVARAVLKGLTDDVPADLSQEAAAEGWIRFPSAGVRLPDLA